MSCLALVGVGGMGWLVGPLFCEPFIWTPVMKGRLLSGTGWSVSDVCDPCGVTVTPFAGRKGLGTSCDGGGPEGAPFGRQRSCTLPMPNPFGPACSPCFWI